MRREPRESIDRRVRAHEGPLLRNHHGPSQRRNILFSARRLQIEGKPQILLTLEDITERRHAHLQAMRLAEIEAASAGEAGTGPQECLHRESSRASGFARGRMVLFLERFARELHGFGDGRSADRSPPLPNNLVPVHSLSHLLEHLRDPYPGAPKGWLTVADFWIGHDVLAESLLSYCAFPRVFLLLIIFLASRTGQSNLRLVPLSEFGCKQTNPS